MPFISAKSNKVNQLKLKKINDRGKFIDSIIQEATQELYSKHCVPENKQYQELLKRLIVQCMIKMQEPYLKIKARKKDFEIIQSMLMDCINEFKEIMMRETKKTMNVELELDNVDFLPETGCGGVVVSNKENKISCIDNIDFRMKLCYEEALPLIRKQLLIK